MTKNWKKPSQRGLSLLVCLVMCLSMLPGVAWAEGGLRCNYSGPAGVITCDNDLTYVPQVDPTCGTEGIAAHYNCPSSWKHGDRNYDLSGNYLSDPVERIPKVPCEYQLVSSTATCGDAGTATYKCKWCGGSKEETAPATGNHIHGEPFYESKADATCNTPDSRVEVVSCSVCGGEVSRKTITGEINPDNHDTTGKLEWKPLDGGTHHGQVWSCCGAKVENSEQQHSYADGAPTCTTSVACDACGYMSTNPNAHTPGEAVRENEVSATCAKDGSYDEVVRCSACEEVISRVNKTIPATGAHNWASTWSSDDTSHWHECSVCYAKKNEAGHTYGEATWVLSANKTSASKIATCSACGHEKFEFRDQRVTKSYLAPNCTLPGGYKYTVKTLSETIEVLFEETASAFGHADAKGLSWVYDSRYSGYHVKKCNNKTDRYTGKPVACNEILTKEACTIEHVVQRQPTCTESGMWGDICKVCNHKSSGGWIDPLDHDYGDPTWKWNATSGSATATFTCTRNGCTHVETVKAEVTSVAEPANCIKEGSITYTATVTFNEKTYTAEKVVTIPATGIHDYDEDGVCKICGDVHPTDHKHVYDMEKGTVTTKATCTTQGVTSYPCKYCNATLEVVALPLGHEYTSEVTTPATCIAEGVQTYTCHREGCSDFYTEGLPLVPHTLTVHAKKEPTCTENGMEAHSTCSVCNGFFTGAGTSLEETAEDDLVILATNHTYVAVVTDPTCTEGGYIMHTCTKCGDSYTDTQTNAVGHAYGAWIITAAPTMSAPGEARRICANDVSHVETAELPQLPAPGTPDSVWTLDAERSTAPTCTESGENVYVSVYGEARVSVPALDHSFPAAWTYDGANHWHACPRCGAAGGAAAHAYDGGVVTLAPTAYTAGVRTYTCTACGRYYTEAIPATGTAGPVSPVFPAPDPGTSGGGGAANPSAPTETILDEDTPLAGITFDDVMPTDPFYEAVQYVFNRKLMNGVSDTSFDPYGTLTRAMVVTILYRLDGEPAAEPSAFLDVAAGQWYTDAVGWGAANKVVKGYSEDRFGPMDPVTREQLAAILHRYAQYKGYDVTEIADLAAYADMASISEYALEAMAWAVALGAPEALSETALAPRDNATRAQVAVAFMNFCEKYIPLETEGEAA